jgi:hypothetical protein
LSPEVAANAFGALGVVAGTATVETAEKLLVPMAFVVVTWNT